MGLFDRIKKYILKENNIESEPDSFDTVDEDQNFASAPDTEAESQSIENEAITLYFDDGFLEDVTPAGSESKVYNARFYVINGKKYDLCNVNDIKKIPIPKWKTYGHLSPGVTKHIEYILRKNASDLEDISLELALAGYRKCNDMMIACPVMNYPESEYIYSVKCLIKMGRFEEAVQELNELKQRAHKVFYFREANLEYSLKDARELGTDLVEASYCEWGSAKEYMYQCRVYSISGKDRRFPKLPKDIAYTRISLSPYIERYSTPVFCSKEELVEYSNRPFKDGRSEEAKAQYQKYVDENNAILEAQRNFLEYYKILHYSPEYAPKNEWVYARIKRGNKEQYLKIKENVIDKNKELFKNDWFYPETDELYIFR